MTMKDHDLSTLRLHQVIQTAIPMFQADWKEISVEDTCQSRVEIKRV